MVADEKDAYSKVDKKIKEAEEAIKKAKKTSLFSLRKESREMIKASEYPAEFAQMLRKESHTYKGMVKTLLGAQRYAKEGNYALVENLLKNIEDYRGDGKEKLYRRAAIDCANYAIRVSAKNPNLATSFVELAKKFEKLK